MYKGLRYLLFLWVIIACEEKSPSSVGSDRAVYIQKSDSGYSLIRKGSPFKVKGVAGQDSLTLLKQIGGNTIRTYDTVGLKAVLNKAHAAGMAVIVGIPLPKSNEKWFYDNNNLIAAYKKSLASQVVKYKAHPALLFWCLGNEPNYYDFFNYSFATAYNQFVDTLKQLDPNHPVAWSMANFSDRAIINISLKISRLDLIMFNTFGRLPELQQDMQNYEWLWDGPFLIGEYGVSGPWETDFTSWKAPLELDDIKKAERLKYIYKQLPNDDHRCLGSLAFFWGQRQEVTGTWFNYFSDNKETNTSVFALADLWGEPITGNVPPVVSNLRIDGSNEYNRLLFNPGSLHVASAAIMDADDDSLFVQWDLKPEDWLLQMKNTPASIITIPEKYDSASTSILKFQVPEREGPYRLFVKVTDGQGHFSSTNMPFYVVR
ncbi:hypothetical protein LVD15_25280 [Fulvivirga maritima]|uniref:glycoside hydrolase family 2 TIM barrel-domain containing protein n=1 Tax=Fulvivirga maritima TaxID=2904247 RepID=UPI001F29C459|nr:glycoside hydrolase family 2 TIM barrel-domain containing protein [Fulvivirga maritima]UII26569.1 hypothetical protein LVD15_25280 [Fulvivirga maritima]